MATPQEQATQIVSDYQTQVAKIQTDIQLSNDGKRIALAKAYTTASDQVRQIKDARDSDGRTRRQQLEQQIFGMPSSTDASAVSYRDALDRVQRVQPTDNDAADELADLYEQARISSDTLLAKAVLKRAFDLQLVNLVNQYIEDNPSTDAPINELWTIANAPRINVLGDLAFNVNKPSLLAAYDDVTIRNIASQNATASSDPSTGATMPTTTASY